MKPVEKLHQERARRAQELDAAMSHTAVLRHELERMHLLSSDSKKDDFAHRVVRGKKRRKPKEPAQQQQAAGAAGHAAAAAVPAPAAKAASRRALQSAAAAAAPGGHASSEHDAGEDSLDLDESDDGDEDQAKDEDEPESPVDKLRRRLQAASLGPQEPGGGRQPQQQPATPPDSAAADGVTQLSLPTQMLIDRVKTHKHTDYKAAQVDLEVERQQLEAQRMALEREEERLARRSRVRPKGLVDALREDERLMGLTAKEVLQEFRQGGRAAGGMTLDMFVSAKDALHQAAHLPGAEQAQGQDGGKEAADGDGERTGDEEGSTEGEGGSEEEGDDDEDEEEEGEEESGSSGEGAVDEQARALRAEAREARSRQRQERRQKRQKQRQRQRRRGAEAAGGPGGGEVAAAGPPPPGASVHDLLEYMKAHRQQQRAAPEAADVTSGAGADAAAAVEATSEAVPPITNDRLVSALQHELPAQESAVRTLHIQQDVLRTKLDWARYRPPTYHGELACTAKSRGTKAMCSSLVSHLLDLAMYRIANRPTRAEVAAQLGALQQSEPAALHAICRHLADATLRDVVDELIGEAFDEVSHLHKVANTFAFDMLVESVAFSQRKYDFAGGADNVRARLRDAARMQEEMLTGSLAAKRAMAKQRNMSRSVALMGEELALSGAGLVSGGEQDLGVLASGSLPGRAELAAQQHELEAQRVRRIKHGEVLGEEYDEEAIYVMQRQFEEEGADQLQLDQKQLYVLGLKAMLEEMRMRRADMPYGHTQQLQLHWPPYVKVSKAYRMAAQRMHAPLAAPPSAVRRLMQGGRVAKASFAPFPRAEHLAAAGQERAFWCDVLLSSAYLTAKGLPMIQVFKELGPITCLSISPNGAFLAVGTAPGAMLVFDMRNGPIAPWFQVLGDGQTYKRPWWWRRRRPRNPAIMAISWSMDGYQLASLDASSTARMWWLRPELGKVVKEDAARQPVAPELALSLGPLAVTLSGKAPLVEPLAEDEAAGAWGTGGVAAMAAAEPGAVPPRGQRPAVPGGPGGLGPVAARKWCVAFHPEFNIAAVQPTLLVPQVTGDVLKVVTQVGNTVLATPLPRTRARRRPLLNQQTVNFLLPPQLPHPDVRFQSILRGHDAHVVYCGVLEDCATVATVDMHGEVNLWPAWEADRTGFGWFQPRSSWQMPRTLTTFHARGPLHPVWPRLPVPALKGMMYNPPPPHLVPPGVGNRLFRKFDIDHPTTAAAVSHALVGPPPTYQDLVDDAGLLDDDEEPFRLEELPLGDFLLASRTLWMTRFLVDAKGRLVREELHRPMEEAGGRPLVVSTFTVPQQQPQPGGLGPHGRPVVSAGDACEGGDLIRRAKQYAVLGKMPYRVVSADMTPSRRELLLWCRVAPQPGDPHSFTYFSGQLLGIEGGMRPSTPRIDVYDHSRGAAAPAYAVSPRVPGLGSEYLFVGLGHGLMAVFSLATGQQVRTVALPGIHQSCRYFTQLQLWTVDGSLACRNAGRTFLAATTVDSLAAHVYQLNDEAGVQQAVQVISELGPGMAPVIRQPRVPSARARARMEAAAAAAAAARTSGDGSGAGHGADGDAPPQAERPAQPSLPPVAEVQEGAEADDEGNHGPATSAAAARASGDNLHLPPLPLPPAGPKPHPPALPVGGGGSGRRRPSLQHDAHGGELPPATGGAEAGGAGGGHAEEEAAEPDGLGKRQVTFGHGLQPEGGADEDPSSGPSTGQRHKASRKLAPAQSFMMSFGQTAAAEEAMEAALKGARLARGHQGRTDSRPPKQQARPGGHAGGGADEGGEEERA